MSKECDILISIIPHLGETLYSAIPDAIDAYFKFPDAQIKTVINRDTFIFDKDKLNDLWIKQVE